MDASQLLPVAETIAALLKARKETIAISESSAGGLVSAALVAQPGASAFYVGGAVVYTLAARRTLLALPDEAVKGVRSSTEAYARIAARAIRERLGTTWGLAESGASGPTGNPYGDPPGHTCVAVSGPVERSLTLETGSADRGTNMTRFSAQTLELLLSVLTA
jgi:nicotinamide-nucleotide amidase